MKKICGNCEYWREAGAMDANIPGTGQWCSNSLSPRFRTRVGSNDSSDGFAPRGKKAPIMMRLKVKGMGLINRIVGKK